MLTANRWDEIGNSPIVEAMQLVNKYREAGKNIISLAAGEPEFATPEHIIHAGKTAMDRGLTGYTCEAGMKSLRVAICEKFKRDNNLDYTPDEVISSNGGKQIITMSLMALLNPGDEVIIPAPYWTSYPNMTRINGGVPVIVNCSQENGFKITPSQLEEAITDKTKMLIINSPGNPSGAVYTKKELKNICSVILRYPNVVILSDDVYEHQVYSVEFATPAQAAPELKNRIITMNSVSKSYCMPGWRIGYAGGSKEIIQTMHKIQAQTTMHPCSISQFAAITALTGPQEFLSEHRAHYRTGRATIVNLLNEIDGISCLVPDGAFYAYPSVAGLLGRKTPSGKILQSDVDVMEYFVEEAEVATIYGKAFGLSLHLRISYSTSLDVIERACERIKEACKKLS